MEKNVPWVERCGGLGSLQDNGLIECRGSRIRVGRLVESFGIG